MTDRGVGIPRERQVQRDILKMCGLRTPRAVIERLTPTIIAECAQGRSQQIIATRHGLAVNTVRAILRRNNALPSAEATKAKRIASIAKGRLGRKTKTLAARVNEKVIVRNGCWGWTGAKDSHGYPQIYCNGRKRLVSHVALEIAGRERPTADHCALHTCDNPECTNPTHLWWGTRSENTQDAIAKGRLKPFGKVAK